MVIRMHNHADYHFSIFFAENLNTNRNAKPFVLVLFGQIKSLMQ